MTLKERSPEAREAYLQGYRAGVEAAARLLDEWAARPAQGMGEHPAVDALVKVAEHMATVLALRIRSLTPTQGKPWVNEPMRLCPGCGIAFGLSESHLCPGHYTGKGDGRAP